MACATHEPVSGGQPPDPPDPDELGTYRLPKIGVDVDGDSHYHDVRNGRIVVSNGSQVECRSLNGRRVSDWITVVEDRVGWRTLGWLEAFADAYRSAVEEVEE